MATNQGREERQDDVPAVAQVLRSGIDAAQLRVSRAPNPEKNDEERISLFWRVFGGTILSICALVAVTLYNNISNTLTDLRAEVNKINEARADLIRKDEFNSRMTSSWDRMQTLQRDNNVQNATLTSLKMECEGLKERVTRHGVDAEGVKKDTAASLDAIKKDLTAATDAIKKDAAAIDALKDRIAALNTDLKVARDDVQKVRQDLDRELTMDVATKDRQLSQFKQYDDTMKEIQRGMQDCREKLARLEGLYGPPVPAPAAPTLPVKRSLPPQSDTTPGGASSPKPGAGM